MVLGRKPGRSDSSKAGDGSKPGIAQSGSELIKLVIAYVKQETLGPIKSLGKFLAFGLAGSITFGIGVLILLLAVLRVLQTETDSKLNGGWSFVPYLAVIVVAVVTLAISATRIAKGAAAKRNTGTPNKKERS